MTKLDKEAIEAIEIALNGGYDVEVRKNKNGVTIASMGKKVIYKKQPTIESRCESQNERLIKG